MERVIHYGRLEEFKMGDGISRPTSSDWSEPTVKCKKCGAMFDYSIYNEDNGKTAICPVCQKKENLETAWILDASNEEF
jgi:formylmethanofuran dehydrogenase subunit E